MNVVKLSPFGAEITDIDLRLPRTADQSAQLLALFNEHYLLLFRGQDLSDDDHRRVFHDMFPGEDLGDETGTGSEVSYVSNIRPDGVFGDAALSFHSDFSFTTQPTRLISLYGFDVEAGSAPTEFSNGELALKSLPPDLRAYLDDKKVVSASNLMAFDAHLPSYNLPGHEDLSGRTHEEIVRAAWPVIMEHPRTGRPQVYVNELHAHHLHEVSLSEGREVLEKICKYLYAPNQIYSHDWKQGEFVLWDNIALSHGRRATSAKAAKRTLRRVRGGGATSPTMTSLSQFGLEASNSGPDGDDAFSPELQLVRRALGERIRSHRLALGWTQPDLGRNSGIGYERVSMFEIGIWLPSDPELRTLARTFGIDRSLLTDGLNLDAVMPGSSALAHQS